MNKRKVIILTDGDSAAQKAVEIAAKNIGGRCISASAGNPSMLTNIKIIELVKETDYDPVVVMVDDTGKKGKGCGEKIMESLLEDDDVEVIGVVGVSSNGKECGSFKPLCSIDKDGNVINGNVDKFGNNIGNSDICGDTLSILRDRKDLIMVGIGDPGKMDYNDDVGKGAPITTTALKEVMKRAGENMNKKIHKKGGNFNIVII